MHKFLSRTMPYLLILVILFLGAGFVVAARANTGVILREFDGAAYALFGENYERVLATQYPQIVSDLSSEEVAVADEVRLVPTAQTSEFEDIKWGRFINLSLQGVILDISSAVFTQCASVFGRGVFAEKAACHTILAPTICAGTLMPGVDQDDLTSAEMDGFITLVEICVRASELPSVEQVDGMIANAPPSS